MQKLDPKGRIAPGQDLDLDHTRVNRGPDLSEAVLFSPNPYYGSSDDVNQDVSPDQPIAGELISDELCVIMYCSKLAYVKDLLYNLELKLI